MEKSDRCAGNFTGKPAHSAVARNTSWYSDPRARRATTACSLAAATVSGQRNSMKNLAGFFGCRRPYMVIAFTNHRPLYEEIWQTLKRVRAHETTKSHMRCACCSPAALFDRPISILPPWASRVHRYARPARFRREMRCRQDLFIRHITSDIRDCSRNGNPPSRIFLKSSRSANRAVSSVPDHTTALATRLTS